MFIGIFMLPFYLKHLGAEAYGLVGFFTMLTSIMMLLDMGLSSTLTREIAKSKNSIGELIKFRILLRSVETIFVFLSLVSFVFIYIFSGWISEYWLDAKILTTVEIKYCIVLMGGMLGFRWLSGLYGGCINGLERQVWLNIYKVVFATLKFVGALVFIVYISNDIKHFFEYQLLLSLFEFSVIAIKLYNILPPGNNKITPSLLELKRVAPFALSIAYVGSIWIILTQVDKLMLSHFLPLKEYGYFALVAVVANAIMQISSPISQAIIPRLTVLFAENNFDAMFLLYKKSTQYLAIISLSVGGTISVFSTELLYAWTGSIEAATYAGPILFWYALGNTVLTLLSLQYFLQYAHGNLTHHVKGNTLFGFAQILCMILAIYYYGALGAGVGWFLLQLFFFFFWTAYIHKIFAPNLHKEWLLKDVFPIAFSTIFVLSFFYFLHLELINLERTTIFIILLCIGCIVLLANIIISSEGRRLLRYVARVTTND